MAYRLSITDDVASSVRTCAREQLAGAIRRLRAADEDPVRAVHDARKHLKKTRALLRLVRPALGRAAYRRENDALREAGLALSGARDADVLVATADALAAHAAGRLPADVFDQLRDALAAEAAAARADGDGELHSGASDRTDGEPDGGAPDLADVIAALEAAERRVDAWPLAGAGHATLLAGVTRAYARGREARAAARAEPDPELLHAWRKRAKDLWYHERLLAPAWPVVLKAHAKEAHRLTELLGDDHDLAVLDARLASAAPLAPAVDAARAELRALVADRSARLRADAHRLGDRVYAESPKAFRRRLGRHLRAAVAERADAPDSIPPG